jgi:2-keto-4-pentenoate hydratase/2-oxohepta-3-ene-1,7-dioic acid hydratase in catechol pathway
MRLVTFIRGSERRVGAVVGDGIIDLTRRLGIASVRQAIAEGRLAEAERAADAGAADFRLADVTLDVPLPDPGKILCVGVNYVNRNAEYKDGSEAPKFPSLFMRTPHSFVAPGAALVIPRESAELDYEGEIVLVIGKSGRRITQADAMRHVAGLTIMNEGSVRDWIRHGKFNVTQGKNFDRSGSFGPWIETALKGLDLDHLRLETRVNGDLRQSDTTASMTFPFARIIEYISTFTTLLPGDLIATGTPTGSGGRFDPPRWLKAGDIVEVTVEGIGTLKNGVIGE